MIKDPAERIELALVRIEAASAAKSYAFERLERRHAKLRTRIEAAMSTLDSLIARESEPDEGTEPDSGEV